MAPTPEQESQIERLYENEAIIDNLTSEIAQAVLQWAEQQIQDGKDAQAVVAAVSEANRSGAADAEAALASAKQALGRPPTLLARKIQRQKLSHSRARRQP